MATPALLPYIPDDCLRVIRDFLPLFTLERCFMCGTAVIRKDRRNRLHFEPHIACTESVILCSDCFENFYD